MFLHKKLHSLLIAALVATSVTVPSAAFAESPAASTGSAETRVLAGLGLVDGTTDGMYDDDAPITRGQAAIVLDKVLHPEAPAALTGFLDVTSGHPAAEAVYALKEQGIVKGGAGASFKPDAALTREQLASLFVRALQLNDNGIQVNYTDASAIPPYHRDDAARLKQHFIVEGTAFEGKKTVTHEQFGRMLYRALSLDIYGKEGVLPIEDFIRQPAQYGFKSSPDGTRTAFMAPYNNRMNVFVKKNGEQEAVRVTNAEDRNIVDYAWKSDTKLIYAQDKGGDENYHIYSINVDGTGNRDLTPYDNTLAYLVDVLKDQPDEILIAMNKRDPRFFDVYRLNVSTGDIQLVAENPGNISGWLTDHEGKLRVAVSSDGNESVLLYRDAEDKPFTELLKTGLGDTFSPAMFTYDNKQLYVVSNVGRDKTAIEQFDPATKTTVKTLYENPDVDVLAFIPSKEDGKIAAALYETDKIQYKFFDTELEKVYNKLKELVPGKEISFQEISKNGNLMFFAYNDKSMGTYYTYDANTGKAELLAEVAPWVDETKMAETKPITYTAGDGLTLHGYLTLPKGADPKNLPLIVNPHGGPWARDSFGYNPEVQFLANRDFAVLQVNFRGSTGYGKKFLEAGNKQWGKAMQSDLTDGVNWLVKEGIADPKRVGIYGGSYGGYAALAGLAFTPDVYAAGVSYVGPSNLFTLLDSLPPYWESERKKFYERVGDPAADKALLESISPLFHVDKIKAPLFVVQGANDPRVKQAESDQIVEALQERGVDVPYMLKLNEGHGFANIENQLDFYYALEKFLYRSLMQP